MTEASLTQASLLIDADAHVQDDSDRERDGSSSGSRDRSPMATFRSSMSPVSIVASIGAEEGGSRIDALVLRQQRLHLKLEEMKAGKTVTKGFERGTFLKAKNKFSTSLASLNSAPSMWSPPDGHVDLEKGGGIHISSNPSDVQVRANPDLQRILKGDWIDI